RLREEIKPPPITQRRWGRIGIAALALIVVVAVVLFVANRPRPIRVLDNSLVQIDPTTNEIVADVPVADPGGSQLTAVPPHEIWVLSQRDQVISVVDASTHEVHSVGVFGGQATFPGAGYGIVYAAGEVWVYRRKQRSLRAGSRDSNRGSHSEDPRRSRPPSDGVR